MKIAMCLEPEVSPKWHYALQMGVTEAVAISDAGIALWDMGTLARYKKLYTDFGFQVSTFEGWLDLNDIKTGGPLAALQTGRFIQTIRNFAAQGIEVYCYNWMANIGWKRTQVDAVTRGGALTTIYDHRVSEASPEAKLPPEVRAVDLWSTLERFLDQVLPICEAEGVKLAMHPDDPPLERIFDVERIMGSMEAFERLLALSPSPSNGITMCQGNFAAMNADVPAAIRQLGRDGRIHFAHFRDIEGDAYHIEERFHDDGKTDMRASMQAYHDIGFAGAIRPDHAPVMYGEENTKPGYQGLGRIFAVGYMKGLIEGMTPTSNP
ncbi:mannonate dehydratase [Rhodophyticola sp. CCM32]|uniref:mannonate dehydratase n=1 Tax=Rhodophyticola sp. CCM32 TaxID=2916397 RepID=UPI00107EF8EB|nr:mannonate dehydratase [Rhodophyticola sp. CCM32]QBY01218.1 mannonate dehydratase [Rhodophyticola sp. CCM32]